MRKILALFALVAIIATMFVSAFADRPSEPFDYKKLEGLERYQFDKFEKTYTYSEIYTHKNGNMKINLLMAFTNALLNYDCATLAVNIADGSKDHTVKSIDFWIDDVVYSFKSMWETGNNASAVFLGASSFELMEALLNAKEASVRITLDSSTETFDVDEKEFSASLRKFCENAYELGFIDYFEYDVNDKIAAMEAEYPITITK